MKSKLKYILTHINDTEKEKIIVTKDKKSGNDIDYFSGSIYNGIKHTEVTMHEDGNCVTIYNGNGKKLRLDYSEVTSLFVMLETYMREAGYVKLKVK
jgi:hypothetical protein